MCYYFQEYLPLTCWARTLEDWTSAPRPTWHPLDHQPIPWWQAMPWRWACQPPWQQICPLQWPRVPWGWGEFLQTKAWWEWTWAWIWAWPLQWWWVAWLAWEFQEWGWASHTPSAQPWFHPNKMPSLILAVLGNEGVRISVYECVCESVRERERQNESVSMHVWHYESRNHWRTAVLENNIACFSFCFCTLWRVGIGGRSPWPWRQRRAPTGAPRLEAIRCVKWCHTEDTLRAGKVSAHSL